MHLSHPELMGAHCKDALGIPPELMMKAVVLEAISRIGTPSWIPPFMPGIRGASAQNFLLPAYIQFVEKSRVHNSALRFTTNSKDQPIHSGRWKNLTLVTLSPLLDTEANYLSTATFVHFPWSRRWVMLRKATKKKKPNTNRQPHP
jgi:hypothetical protein